MTNYICPERPKNYFVLFCEDVNPIIREEYPDMNSTEITKLSNFIWEHLSDKDKYKYYDLQYLKRVRYEEEMKNYKQLLYVDEKIKRINEKINEKIKEKLL